ncbi:MAG TPA: flagellar filament capping protein FliD [Vicinamibacterales bacterium]|nr:flagellar filament capping protein FliD [Vicinamibacterales bacterium]
MASGITFSGFNDIDFNLILNSIMQQESQPLRALEDQQTALRSRVTTLDLLANRVSALETASDALSSASAAASFKATTSDATALGVSAGSGAVPGRYDIVVSQLARAQVTASTSTVPDADTTIVADGGTLTIGGETITLSGPVTLAQLAAAINGAADAPARASVVQSAPGSFQLVLTGKSTGEANAFAVTSGLSGGSGVAFGANAVDASDAELTVNNIPITSASNTLDSVVPGTTVTLYRQDPTATVVVDVASDPSALKTRLESFVSAYNDLVKFANDQSALAGKGDQSSIGRDPVLRQLRSSLRSALTTAYPNAGSFQSLAEIGVELQQNGTLELESAKFDAAIAHGLDDVAALLGSGPAAPGAFAGIETLLQQYSGGNGLVSSAKTQLTSRMTRLDDQMARMQERLAARRLALQREFTAADEAMSLLKTQSGSLSAFGASL